MQDVMSSRTINVACTDFSHNTWFILKSLLIFFRRFGTQYELLIIYQYCLQLAGKKDTRKITNNATPYNGTFLPLLFARNKETRVRFHMQSFGLRQKSSLLWTSMFVVKTLYNPLRLKLSSQMISFGRDVINGLTLEQKKGVYLIPIQSYFIRKFIVILYNIKRMI